MPEELKQKNIELYQQALQENQNNSNELIIVPQYQENGTLKFTRLPNKKEAMELGANDPLFLALTAGTQAGKQALKGAYDLGVKGFTKLQPYLNIMSPGTKEFMTMLNSGIPGKIASGAVTAAEGYWINEAIKQAKENPNIGNIAMAGLSVLPYTNGAAQAVTNGWFNLAKNSKPLQNLTFSAAGAWDDLMDNINKIGQNIKKAGVKFDKWWNADKVKSTLKYLDDVALKNITPYRNYKVTKEFGKLVDGTVLPNETILYQEPKTITFSPNKVTEGKSYLRLVERPSKLAEVERLGIPTSLRNNKTQVKDIDDNTTLLRKHINEKGKIPEDIQPIPFTEEEIAKAIPEIAENMKYSNRSYLADKNKKYLNAFPNEDNDLIISNIKSYLNQFSDVEINPSFLKKDGNQSHYIAMYRNYMYNMGYDTSNLSNEEIAKLLTLQYNNLTANQTGQMKGQLLWHSSPKIFDEFDWKAHVGDNFGNMGGAGPANYFSLIGGTSYGRAKNPFGEFIFINDQPYLLNNISSIPSRNVLVKKGIKPEYTSPLHSEELNAYKARVIDQALAKTKEGNMLVIDDFMIPVKGIMDNNMQVEFALTRNSGIKSLYPHPSLFVRNLDGTVTVARNWNDLKVNYKQGGSIYTKEKNKQLIKVINN